MNEVWWSVFNENRKDIIAIVSMYCRRGGCVEEFEKAVAERDISKMMTVMNDAWFHAPDHRQVYNIPGFSKMCCLLDGSYEDAPDFI